ncbi:MAG: tetratricopeptide repeat protein [Clostridium sp.]
MNKKRYKRASEYYEKGDLKKALNECEKGISENLKDASLLNLKGIILYQKGDLDEARITWNVNREFNDDELSKTYLRDIKSDEERKILYLKGEKALKELKVDKAIELLEQCRETSFNGVKVNTAMALCYLKKGAYDESKFYALEALKIDKNYLTAKNILAEIDTFNGNKKMNKNTIMIAVFVVSILVGGALFFSNKGEAVNIPPVNAENIENDKSETVQNKEENPLNISLIKKSIEEKDVDTLYINLKVVDKDTLSDNDKLLIEEGFTLLKNEGVEKFYSQGREYIKQKNYNNANEELSKAYDLGKEHYLYPHIVYLTGVSEEKLLKNEEAIKYYEEYVNNYKDGDYIEEVLYNLALLNKSIDKDKSKKYAKRLNKEYPKSIYNNQNIKEIIEG